MTATTALQSLVSAEQAAAFGLSAAGGRLDDLAAGSAAATAVRAGYDVHRLRRDAWIARLRAADGAVPPAAAAYALPLMDSATQAVLTAAGIEQRCAEAYAAALAGITTLSLRTQLVAALGDAAQRSYALLSDAGQPAAQASTALPGQPG